MSTFDIKSILSTLAPTVAGMLAGPEASVIVTALEKAVSVEPGAGLDGVSGAIQNGLTGDQIVAIHQMELQYKTQSAVTEATANVAVVNAEVSDRNSARTLQTSTNSWLYPTVTLLIILGAMTACLLMLLGYGNAQNPAVGVILGALMRECTQVINSLFGGNVQNIDTTK